MKSFKESLWTVKSFCENNKLLLLVWIAVCVSLLFSNNISFSKKIIGYVDNQKIDINFKQPARVEKILVSSGKKASKGDLIAILDAEELELLLSAKVQELNNLEVELDALNSIHFFDQSNKTLRTSLKKKEGLLLDQIKSLKDQIQDHLVTAPYDCVVSDIFYEEGELVPAMQPLFSIQKESTDLVHAFINETDNFPLKPGQKVVVENIHSTRKAEGKIVTMSNEYKQMPVRISGAPSLTAANNHWGTRVTIQLEDPAFRRGEKVLIKSVQESTSSPFFINDARAEKSDKSAASLLIQADKEFSAIEGIDDNLFLVADDEGDKLADGVFLYDKESNEMRGITVQNDFKIEDIEAIAKLEDNRFLVVASQSLTKSGKAKPERFKALLAVYDAKRGLKAIKEIPLRKNLLKKLKESYPQEAKVLERDLDIESAEEHQGDLYFALKNPRLEKKALIIKHPAKDFIEKGFAGAKAEIIAVNLPNLGQEISDLQIYSESEVLISLVKDDKSALYKTDLRFENFEALFESEEKIEGMERLSDDYYVLATDQGKKGGKIKRINTKK